MFGMLVPDEIIARTGSAEETKWVSALLAQVLDLGSVVLLSGDLGAGKTQFVQGVAFGLGACEVPLSPTFNLVLTYGSGRMPLHHFDLYRLDDESQLDDIGIKEYLDSDGVCFIEWAEKFPQVFDEHLSIAIRKESDEARIITAHAQGLRYEKLLQAWRSALADAQGGMEEPWALGSAEPRASLPGEVQPGAGVGEKAPLIATHVAADSSEEPGRRAGTESPRVNQNRSKEGASAIGGPMVLAIDTANEVVAIGVGELVRAERSVRIVATRELHAHRASNTQLIPQIDELLTSLGVARCQISCICVGRGPGSFTGVRIAMATAKGMASALGVGLVGVSSLDAIAHNAQAAGVRGRVLVVADAMRKEVYPVYFDLTEKRTARLTADRVVKAEAFAAERHGEVCAVLGDALAKYAEPFAPLGVAAPKALWPVSGRGLLMALQAAWQDGKADPFDADRHNPAFALPVYTRLSDAEENERAKLAKDEERNLVTGVQDVAADGGKGRATMHATARLFSPSDECGLSLRPLDHSAVQMVALLETQTMGSDAWSQRLVADELSQRNRSWWIAEHEGKLVGYAGGMVVDGDLQILKVAVAPQFRRRGIARELMARVAEDARNLGAQTCSLEVRAGNAAAQAFYETLGFESLGVRPGYYSDREDALIMRGPLPVAARDVAGMQLVHNEATSPSATGRPSASLERPLILAIESSCDETAAAVVDGEGALLSDVVASQIDFHARFGGVVPEIASRKHIEAICGVCAEALESASLSEGASHGRAQVRWSDLDAVAVTYAPGLVGALVVGVAFAKGAAWALDVPFIGVNHLEGHLYANKIGKENFKPPAVVSLVSGGNTMLVHMRDWGEYVTLGATIDDAVGEAFDKVAKALGLGYPGGPVISREAAKGNAQAIDFPRAMIHSHDLRFSLSGLKTAVVNYINKERQAGREPNVPDVAASFQQAVVDVQVAKAKAALEQTDAKTFCLGGGVAANPALRAAYEKLCADMGVRLVMPPLTSCGDNAGMIALVALDRYKDQKFFSLDADAYAHADLDEPY